MKLLAGVLLIVMGILAACAPPAPEAPADAPTVEEASPEPSETPTRAPATETPFRRPTLPPTWTPTPEPTLAPTEPTSTLPFIANATTGANMLVGNCLQFGPDLTRNPTSVVVGNAATVYWNPAGGGVFYYEVVLRDANGAEVDLSRRQPSSRQYTFTADLFDFNSVYTWSITPYNSAAEPICESRTSELRATLR